MVRKKNYKNTGAYLRQLYDSLVENLHERLEGAGYGEITPSHGLVFQYIRDEGSRITRLATMAGITKQSMSALVYQLEGRGYLTRKEDPEDARAVLFVLTARGYTLKATAQGINFNYERQWENTLGRLKYREFRKMLEQLASMSSDH